MHRRGGRAGLRCIWGGRSGRRPVGLGSLVRRGGRYWAWCRRKPPHHGGLQERPGCSDRGHGCLRASGQVPEGGRPGAMAGVKTRWEMRLGRSCHVERRARGEIGISRWPSGRDWRASRVSTGHRGGFPNAGPDGAGDGNAGLAVGGAGGPLACPSPAQQSFETTGGVGATSRTMRLRISMGARKTNKSPRIERRQAPAVKSHKYVHRTGTYVISHRHLLRHDHGGFLQFSVRLCNG